MSEADAAAAKVEAMDIDERKDVASSAGTDEKMETGEASKEGETEEGSSGAKDEGGDDGGDPAAAAEAETPAPTADDAILDPPDLPDLLDKDGDDGGDDDDKATPPPADPTELILQAMEQKEEGNAAFKSGDLTGAVRSYRRGTTLLKPLNNGNTGDEQVKSLLLTLQTNLSMVCYKQDKHKMSRDVATRALEVDPCSVKALYRRAAAHRKLGDAESARSDLRDALKSDPTNREVRRELASIKKEVEAGRAKEKERLQKAFSGKSGSSFLYDDREAEEKKRLEAKKARELAEAEAKKARELAEAEAREKRKVEWEDDCVKRMASDEAAISFADWEKEWKEKEDAEEKARKKARKEEDDRKAAERRAAREAARQSEKDAGPQSDDDDDVLTEKEMQMMRGYKKTKDGRTTSYFTREIKEEEKAMLAQVGPKRIDAAAGGSGGDASGAASTAASATTASSSAASTPAPNPAASAWNQAGTWEEKDTTEWCTSCLKRHLTSASATAVPSSDYTAVVTEVTDLTGDASFALTRGKKRYLFDYHLSVSFDVTHSGSSPSANADDIDEEEPDETTPPTSSPSQPEVVATGTLKLPDISSTMTIEELEIEPSSGWKKRPDGAHSDGVLECRNVLMAEIREKVRSFVAEFNSQY